MARTKNSVATRARRKKVLKASVGRHAGRHRLYKTAHEAEMHAGDYAYIGRRLRKRQIRRLWIMRINAAPRQHGLPYGKLMNGLRRAGIEINRKQLAEMAVNDAAAFGKIVESARTAIAA